MIYRELGNTGMKASVVGLGAEHLDGKPYRQVEEVVRTALERGFNIIDCFMPGEEIRRNIGKALGSERGNVLIQGHICSVDLSQQYDISRDLSVCEKYFEGLLACLGTDYIDLGMLFFVDTQEDFDAVFHGGISDYAKRLKRQGRIRAIGASSHNPEIAARMVRTGEIEALMFSVNPAFDMIRAGLNALDELHGGLPAESLGGVDPARAELYSLCAGRGVPITAMKAFGAGKLLSAEHTPFARPLSPAQCIHYALTRPAVASVLAGCCSRAEVDAAAGYLDATERERDYSEAISSFERDFRSRCMYCSHCLPCPSGIDVAAVTKYLDIALLDRGNIPPGVVQGYLSLDARGADCVACGSCERRCPFSVGIIDNMRLAAEVFKEVYCSTY
ncbi:MAG: aldo/keto reductase [Clostridiales Family XIII bacterium]|jgi:predicted aldo/keto reductase-like oxidoreductase|nr:aldo/keto reductase [Clostridiales Family XIII bacterium]